MLLSGVMNDFSRLWHLNSAAGNGLWPNDVKCFYFSSLGMVVLDRSLQQLS